MRLLAVIVFALAAVLATASAQLDKVLAPIVAPVVPAPQTALSIGAAIESPGSKQPTHALTSDEIMPRLEKQIGEHFSVDGELKLGLTSPWKRIIVPAEYDLTVTDYPGQGISSAFIVRCKITANAQSVADLQIPLRAQLWREVWVAAGRLDRGQTLDHSLVNAQKIDVLRERDSLLGTERDPSTFEVAQSVAAGRPLTRRDVSEKPLIHKGEVVDVVARQGLFAVRMKAQALENGVARALITMRNLESRKEFTAEVINENQVQVHF